MEKNPLEKHLVTHVGIVLDESSSMGEHARTVVQVIDNLVKELAVQSQEMRQETRVSVWTFASRGEERCIVWDMDVLRLPSIGTFYKPDGWTALIDGTYLAISDLREIPTKYGDHAFLMYVATDGQENRSRRTPMDLVKLTVTLPDNWTVAALVPDMRGVRYAQQYGFPAGNIAQWDATTKRGIEEFGRKLTHTTTSYMTSRATGVRSTNQLFTMGDDAVNRGAIKAAKLTPLKPEEFVLCTVPGDTSIRTFVVDFMGLTWVIGRGYYELTKRESIQPQKAIALVEKKTSKIYVGRAARDLLNLPDTEVRVSPGHNSNYKVFVQSTSVNRKLKAGQEFLYVK